MAIFANCPQNIEILHFFIFPVICFAGGRNREDIILFALFFVLLIVSLRPPPAVLTSSFAFRTSSVRNSALLDFASRLQSIRFILLNAKLPLSCNFLTAQSGISVSKAYRLFATSNDFRLFEFRPLRSTSLCENSAYCNCFSLAC